MKPYTNRGLRVLTVVAIAVVVVERMLFILSL
jgi:hypothetical protein